MLAALHKKGRHLDGQFFYIEYMKHSNYENSHFITAIAPMIAQNQSDVTSVITNPSRNLTTVNNTGKNPIKSIVIPIISIVLRNISIFLLFSLFVVISNLCLICALAKLMQKAH